MTLNELRNNCTLVAVRELSGKSDEEVLRAFRRQKYRENHGVHDWQYLRALNDLGIRYTKIPAETLRIAGRSGPEHYHRRTDRVTLAQFCHTHDTSVYLVQVPGHVLVVRDGFILDHNYRRLGKRRRVMQAWRIINPAFSTVYISPLDRDEDPLVVFHTWPGGAKRHGTASYDRYQQAHAWSYSNTNNKGVRVSDLIANTIYTRADASHDIAAGYLRRV